MARRTDNNQKQITKDLIKAGVSVRSLHKVGKGIPDLLCGFRGITKIIEIKTEDGELTPDQKEFIENWNGQYAIAKNSEEAIRIMYDSR